MPIKSALDPPTHVHVHGLHACMNGMACIHACMPDGLHARMPKRACMAWLADTHAWHACMNRRAGFLSGHRLFAVCVHVVVAVSDSTRVSGRSLRAISVCVGQQWYCIWVFWYSWYGIMQAGPAELITQ